MALNQYFNRGANNENLLYEDLVIEAIQITGFNVYYMPRTVRKLDRVFGEDTQGSEFNAAIPIEMYLGTPEGTTGESEVIQKFGLEIRDSTEFIVSKRRWEETVRDYSATLQLPTRPAEGDLIYIEFGHSQSEFFVIDFVEQEKPFYQLNNFRTYTLQCNMYTYSNEKFNTGVPAIDSYSEQTAYDVTLFELTSEGGDVLHQENGLIIAQDDHTLQNQYRDYATNNDFTDEAAGFVDFTPDNPFGE